ncbi:uncharacterized protein BDW43DRAFT_277077 [Aspergillus alliaceus]|uniref:uncharacterized protein n=1 Tax=Petromyces alliaceus TaxID=209559 RepID=UPI0012A6F7C8|nr:uncharacterized protein BDW43DRAFT_277077 [Aspergillus alliaceus]KAB8233350.1 hypothetical protein BDW43DRAFT_277077 [Aspergillus alliaceus]
MVTDHGQPSLQLVGLSFGELAASLLCCSLLISWHRQSQVGAAHDCKWLHLLRLYYRLAHNGVIQRLSVLQYSSDLPPTRILQVTACLPCRSSR